MVSPLLKVKNKPRKAVETSASEDSVIRYLPTRRHSEYEEGEEEWDGEGEILAFVHEIATQILSANSSERPGIAPEETPEYG